MLPFWEPRVSLSAYVLRTEVLDVAGKSLVQPQVRPPLGRHQVAEPLVRQFVSNYVDYPLHERRWRCLEFLVVKQVLLSAKSIKQTFKNVVIPQSKIWNETFIFAKRLPVSDETPVFHCTSRKVCQSKHVHLWQRIWDVKVVFEKRENFCAFVCRESCPADHVWPCPYLKK